MLLQADSSCFKVPEVIFEGEPRDGIAAYVELLDPMCNVMLFVCLSGGWASFCRRAALSLIETTLFLSKRERDNLLSLCFLTKETDKERGSSFSI
jgi:hypothetical protein